MPFSQRADEVMQHYRGDILQARAHAAAGNHSWITGSVRGFVHYVQDQQGDGEFLRQAGTFQDDLFRDVGEIDWHQKRVVEEFASHRSHTMCFNPTLAQRYMFMTVTRPNPQKLIRIKDELP